MSAIFLAAFFLVFFKAFQQLNVVHHNLMMITPTSFMMAIGEVGLIVGVVSQGWPAVIPMGAGGSIGCILSMLLHKRFRAWSCK